MKRSSNPWKSLIGRERNVRGYLSDGSIHDPNNIVGTYKYNNPNSWSPKTAGFFARGESYIDPVFNEAVYRMTATDNPLVSLVSENYAHNGLINADNTLYLDFSSVDKRVRSISAGIVTHTGLPAGINNGGDCIFDPVNSSVYYYFSGVNLRKVTLLGGGSFSDVVFKAFAATLVTHGATLDFVDATGRYFVVNVNGTVNVWDSVSDQLFTGTFTFDPVASNGWVGISPSGNYLVYTLNNHTVRQLDLVNKTIGAAITRSGTGGDHADIVSCTDGNDYLIRYDGNFSVESTRLDTGTKFTLITESPTAHAATHFSCVAKGNHRNWAFISFEYAQGIDIVGSYQAYDNEIVMVNILTHEIRRLCHHRGRSGANACTANGCTYYVQQRICVSWDGNIALWGSNFNDGDVIGSPSYPYQDLYYVIPPYPASEGGIVESGRSQRYLGLGSGGLSRGNVI